MFEGHVGLFPWGFKSPLRHHSYIMTSYIHSILTSSKSKRDLILSLQQYLKEKQEEIKTLHRQGASGKYISLRLTTLTDALISGVYDFVVQRYEDIHNISLQERCAIVALGSYGREDMSPYSDIDIMFLYEEGIRPHIEEIAKEVLYLLWDIKYDIGHCTRTIEDCLKIGSNDFTVRTSLMEGRLVTGSEDLFRRFQKAFFNQVVRKNVKAYILDRLHYMGERYKQFGSSVYLIEPNIKEGKGGLRDIQCMKWVILVRYGIPSLEDFHKQGYLSSRGYNELVEAQDFLMRIRNELHFHAGKAMDILTFDEQHRIAKCFGYKDEPQRLGVEAFMQDYYMHATRIHDISLRTIEKAIPISPIKQSLIKFTSRFIEPCYQLTWTSIEVPEKYKDALFSKGENVIYLFFLSLIYGLHISTPTMSMLYRNYDRIPHDLYNNVEAMRIFRKIISWPQGVADILRQMHKVKVLQKVIPEFERIYCYASYDYYHKYTVDEHSFLAVEKAEELIYFRTYIAKVFKEIKRKDLLYLALLLHDIGKGLNGHHADTGAIVAERVGRQLGYNEDEVRVLRFLVQNHLLMSHIAFRRDLSEDKVILLFSRRVATPDILRKLFILTYADIKAVGPDAWNDWKENLLTELYYRAMEELSGTKAIYSEEDLINKLKEEIEEKLCLIYPQEWLDTQLQDMENRYLLVTSSDRIINHLHMINRLRSGDEKVLVDVYPGKNVIEFTIYTYDNIVPGLFSKIAGTLAAAGYNIMGAQVYTTRKGIVVDTFQVEDPYPGGVSSALRQMSVREDIKKILMGETTVEELFEKYKQKRPKKATKKVLVPPSVEIDNETSDEFTIIDIFAMDRQGLLYLIARTLHELGLSIYSAKIATRVDQIVDVFYVKDMDGAKIIDPARLAEIKERLLNILR